MSRRPQWAAWIVLRRREIDRALADRLGAPPLDPAAPEAEALRRFRSFAAASLRRGLASAPALDGVRGDDQRTLVLLDAWCEAAIAVAGGSGEELRGLLAPLAEQFRIALLGVKVVRHVERAPRPRRRAVPAAIDRVADAFVAVDVDTGKVIDANPAAITLLGVTRETLLGHDATAFVRPDGLEAWTNRLEDLAESSDPCRFQVVWMDARRQSIAVEVTATRHATRARTLALVLARPLSLHPSPSWSMARP